MSHKVPKTNKTCWKYDDHEGKCDPIGNLIRKMFVFVAMYSLLLVSALGAMKLATLIFKIN